MAVRIEILGYQQASPVLLPAGAPGWLRIGIDEMGTRDTGVPSSQGKEVQHGHAQRRGRPDAGVMKVTNAADASFWHDRRG